MPGISLVVCVHGERDLLRRLLANAKGNFDDLVVVHDGWEGQPESGINGPIARDYSVYRPDAVLPDGYRVPHKPPQPGSIHSLVAEHGGRFFEGPRCFQQEPHWPFAWSQARHDWILRLDADEFPSSDLMGWLKDFRAKAESPDCAGFTCFWPLWDGSKAVTHRWPRGRSFLFHKERVRFFGMVEQVPIADTHFEDLGLTLHHEPKRKSYGVRNIVFRRQAFHWRRVIARSLAGSPVDLPRWRWETDQWPDEWEKIRRNPLRHSLSTLIRGPVRQFRAMWNAGERPLLSACLNPGLHHALLGMRVYLEMRSHKRFAQ